MEGYESYDYEDYVIDPQFLQPQYFDPNPAKRQYSIQIYYDSLIMNHNLWFINF